ncbi:MAG: hypothetical protein IPM68_16690 [Flavobacteriales bacterium]|nr:hypothetical protein [Flavobacteriales bacterium]
MANDSVENDPYTEATMWMLKDGLYKKLDEDPELQDSLQTMADLYDDLQGTATADFKQIEDGILALYDLDSNAVTQLQTNRSRIDSPPGLGEGWAGATRRQHPHFFSATSHHCGHQRLPAEHQQPVHLELCHIAIDYEWKGSRRR